MALFISNPSRGGAAPSTPGDPTGTKAVDPIRVSLRETATLVDFSSIQVSLGYARVHGLGAGGPFERTLPRTKLGSILTTNAFLSNITTSVVGSELRITKPDAQPGAGTYFTSVDRGTSQDMNAMFTTVFGVTSLPSFAPGDFDPMGPIVGLEHGPRNTAAYCILLNSGGQKVIRICGPRVGLVRSPDLYFSFDWSAIAERQYVLFWDEVRQVFEMWTDDTTGSGGIGNTILIASVPLSQFQQFGGGSAPVGGSNDITGIYGAETTSGAVTVGVTSVAVATDVGYPIVSGGRAGGWRTFLDSDVTMGFSGAIDPTRLRRGGAWFADSSNDPAGVIAAAPGGYLQILKNTPGTSLTIYRDEPGFRRLSIDGLMIEFKCLTAVAGAAIQISDGTSLFEIDFLVNGDIRNLGVLKLGGNPTIPSDHLLSSSAIDFTLRTFRLLIDPRRASIDLYDVTDLLTPIASWPLNRATLPAAATARLTIGLPTATSPTIGELDLYSLKYSYIYDAWESRDLISPVVANPPFAPNTTMGGGPLDEGVMPGVLPLPYFAGGSGGSGVGLITDGGFQIAAAGDLILYFNRPISADVNRGAVVEASLSISEWHQGERTGSFVILDDGDKAYMLSFVEVPTGRFVCIPISAGLGSFQEYAGFTGIAAKLSAPVDWVQRHTYRLERRPRDGVYLFVDGALSLVLPDSAGYSFPTSQFLTPTVAFGQYTTEGSTSLWQFVRTLCGSGYEISTIRDQTQADLQAAVSGARTTVVVSAAGV